MWRKQNISADTQGIPQLRSTAVPRHQKKERWGNNNDTKITYEITNAQTQKYCHRGGEVGGGEVVAETTFTRKKPKPLILIQLQITNISLRKHAYIILTPLNPTFI